MEAFFKLKTPTEVFHIIDGFSAMDEEIISMEDVLGRVLSTDLTAPEDLPDFFKSTMDGYAVQTRNTFGATESLPALLEITGEVSMGESGKIQVNNGQAVKIPTGGMLPVGADGVVMVEYCSLLDEKTLEISRAISPLENTIQPGDDFKKGAVILPAGKRLRPQDMGVLAGLGFLEVPVFRRPRVAILSTGDEMVPVSQNPGPGQVRDINRYTLGALCRNMGAVPVHMGICADHFEPLREMVKKALRAADAVWISGGSSVGTRDFTLKVFETLPDFELLVHGISISPGKPTIIGRSGAKPVIGLPGHPASALVVAEIFMTKMLRTLSGAMDAGTGIHTVKQAVLKQNIPSSGGREDYVRIKLVHDGEHLTAFPLFGKSGLISTLVEADGLARIDMNTEGLYEGDEIDVMLFSHT
ncbi:MAG: molybdopterin molybdotransferase MoeA [Deltaproteobacteria bacterium]|nr:molybdopterin molybdotransferase MoeA [Deltaproteobacteria bacterium]